MRRRPQPNSDDGRVHRGGSGSRLLYIVLDGSLRFEYEWVVIAPVLVARVGLEALEPIYSTVLVGLTPGFEG